MYPKVVVAPCMSAWSSSAILFAVVIAATKPRLPKGWDNIAALKLGSTVFSFVVGPAVGGCTEQCFLLQKNW